MSRQLQAVPLDNRPRRAFIDAVLAGEAAWYDIDEWVECWHTTDTDVPLHEWLGLTFDEYALLGGGDRHLAAILYARRHGLTLQDAEAWYQTESVATRGDGDPHALQDLLVREGLVKA